MRNALAKAQARTDLDLKVSVVINCYNGAQYLQATLESIFAQSYSNWELIFWDNASSDSSASIAKSFGSRVRYFRNDTLVPLYAARNMAIDHCTGDAIAFIDCDDLWERTAIELLVARLDQGVAVAYGKYDIIDDAGNILPGRKTESPSGKITSQILKRNPIAISCALIDAKLLKKYRFDSQYDLLGDFDLWIRLSIDYLIVAVDRSIGSYRHHDSSLSSTKHRSWLKERRIFYRKMIKQAGIFGYPELMRYILKTEIKGLLNLR